METDKEKEDTGGKVDGTNEEKKNRPKATDLAEDNSEGVLHGSDQQAPT